jgi:hypothetical protein
VDDYKLEKDNHNNISTGTDTNGVCNQIKNDSSLEAR